MDTNKHRYYMMQVLLAIFRHPQLSQLLAFKGGTSLMIFHNLSRFSTDLDFNLLDASKTEYVSITSYTTCCSNLVRLMMRL